MLLFVGLGNPGKEYENTRHNMGFSTLDLFCKNILKQEISKKDFQGEYLKTNYNGQDIILLKPMTYMNLSGNSVRELVQFYKIKLEDIVVIYDDMDLDVGHIRLRPSGSSGGHKGIQSIIENLSNQKIKRIRIGIGKSPYSVIDYVLGRPDKEQAPLIEQALNKACLVIEDIITNGFDHAMCHFN